MSCVHDAHVTTPWLQSGIQSIAEPYSKSSLTSSSRSLSSSFPVSAPRLSPRLLPVALFHTALLCILQLTRQNSTAFAHLNFALSLLCILSLSLSLLLPLLSVYSTHYLYSTYSTQYSIRLLLCSQLIDYFIYSPCEARYLPLFTASPASPEPYICTMARSPLYPWLLPLNQPTPRNATVQSILASANVFPVRFAMCTLVRLVLSWVPVLGSCTSPPFPIRLHPYYGVIPGVYTVHQITQLTLD